MSIEQIKGMCEHCGFSYQGQVPSPFPTIKCPRCGKETNNFDSASSVDRQNKAEGFVNEYIESKLEIIELYDDKN